MNGMGAKAFDDLKSQVPIDLDARTNAYVRCVAVPITLSAQGQTNVKEWEIVVFQDSSANAFALPGGKIGVHTGLLNVARNDAQLAAVLGHEVGHVIAKHGTERVSEGIATQGGLALIDAFILGNLENPEKRGLLLGALGLGAQIGFALPHSRTHETEADLIGLDLMSRAGFDPKQSVELWKNMMEASGGQAPPEFMSTHPSNQTRISHLKENLPPAIAKYENAKASGKNPHCVR